MVAVVLLSGTMACQDTREAAISELEEKHYRLTPKEFLFAASTGDIEALQLFFSAGFPPDVSDDTAKTALMAAAENGKAETVARLLEAGANPLLIDQSNRSALIYSAQGGNVAVTDALLKLGAPPRHRDQAGWSCLSLAASQGNAEIADRMASYAEQAELDEALLLATRAGSTETVGKMLDRGAHVDARNPDNLSALMIAASLGHSDTAIVLLKKGANPALINQPGESAAYLAEAAGHLELSNILNVGGNLVRAADRTRHSYQSPRPQTAQKQKQKAPSKSKPLAALQGSVLRGATDSQSILVGLKITSFEPGFQKHPDYATISSVSSQYTYVAKVGDKFRTVDIDQRSQNFEVIGVERGGVSVINHQTKRSHRIGQ